MMQTTSVPTQGVVNQQRVELKQPQQDSSFLQAQVQKSTQEPSQSPIKPTNLDGAFRKKLEAVIGPTRVGANAVIATQLDHLKDVNKPSVISDHLPVEFLLSSSKDGSTTSVASWNMLAEVHKNNNYENIELDQSTKSLFNQGKLDYFAGRNN